MTDYTKLIERLREYKDYIPAAVEALEAIEALQRDKVELGQMLLNLRDTASALVEALQAKLDEMEKQEPVGYTDSTGIAFAVKWSGALPPNLTLYAAPKALEPLTQQRIQELHEQVLREPIRTSGFFESFTRAVEAAHGITKGTQ